MALLNLTEDNFETEVLQSDEPVLVDFYADWCGPCKIQGPIVEELAKIYQDQGVKIGKLNVDLAPKIAEQYQVMSIPTAIIFKDGKPVEQLVGLHDKKTLAAKIEAVKA